MVGKLSFNPLTDIIEAKDGTKFKLEPPQLSPEVPSNGFANVKEVYVEPSADPDNIDVIIDSNSERLQKLEPFSRWDGKDFIEIPVLAKVKGKCTARSYFSGRSMANV